MRLTHRECARLDAAVAAGQAPPEPPSLPGLGDAPTVAMLMRYRRTRLARDTR